MEKLRLFRTTMRFCMMLLVSLFLFISPVCVRAKPATKTPPKDEASQSAVAFQPSEADVPFRSYSSDTLKVFIERLTEKGRRVFVAHIWVADPATQVGKSSAGWGESLALVSDMASEEAIVAVNGSGFMSPSYPSMNSSLYGADEEDSYYTSLGGLVVTDRQVLREVDSVNFTGLALEEDGLVLHQDTPNEEVLDEATDTWAFLDNSVLIADGQIVLEEPNNSHERSVNNQYAQRTVVAKIDDNNYLLVVIRKDDEGYGFNLTQTAEYMMQFEPKPEWAFNLDGGGSSAFIMEGETLAGNQRKVFDCLWFGE